MYQNLGAAGSCSVTKEKGLISQALDAQPLVTDSVVFFVFQCVHEVLTLGAVVVGVEALASSLVNNEVANHSHNLFSFLLEVCASLFVSLL